MTTSRYSIPAILLTALLLLAASAAAQQELVTVEIQPKNTDWQWQDYAESITSLFFNSIDSRVTQGIAAREFLADSVGTTILRFSFRIDQRGNLRHFAPLTPQNRYHAYLIRRTAAKVKPFRPTPDDLPVFYFDGIMTFTCRFQPTRWYKKLYFEDPIDSLEAPAITPRMKPVIVGNLVSSTYEPQVQDKKKLLEDFKSRIGVAEEITDTSSYAALDMAGRVFLVYVPYDSLVIEPMSELLLQARLEKALENAGAIISRQDYDASAVIEAKAEEAAAARESFETFDSVFTAAADSAVAELTGQDTLAVDQDNVSTYENTAQQQTEPADEQETVEEAVSRPSQDTAADQTTESDSDEASAPNAEPEHPVPPGRNLAEAFEDVYKSNFLVFSAGMASDSASDSVLCRIKIYPSDNPDNLKRNVEYKFSVDNRLPDSLGVMLVKRLTNPPAAPKPKAAKKPAPAPETVAPAPADTTAGGPPATDEGEASAPDEGGPPVEDEQGGGDGNRPVAPPDSLGPPPQGALPADGGGPETPPQEVPPSDDAGPETPPDQNQ